MQCRRSVTHGTPATYGAGMTTYVAFLRAINLGATRRFPKEAIVAATEAAGFTDVATHIGTGNVRLSTRMRSRDRIESALEKAYEVSRGFEVPTIVYTASELRDLVADVDRHGDGHDGKHYVWLLKEEPTDAVRRARGAGGRARACVLLAARGAPAGRRRVPRREAPRDRREADRRGDQPQRDGPAGGCREVVLSRAHPDAPTAPGARTGGRRVG